MIKSCIICGELKPLSEYHIKTSNSDGKDNRCKICKCTQRKARYQERKEEELAVNRKWMENNKNRYLKYVREYYQRNKQHFTARTAKRRAYKLKATPVWADNRYITDLYLECREVEQVFSDAGITIKFNVDHIVPLKNKKVCGLHVEHNLQVLTQNENFSKNNSFRVG